MQPFNAFKSVDVSPILPSSSVSVLHDSASHDSGWKPRADAPPPSPLLMLLVFGFGVVFSHYFLCFFIWLLWVWFPLGGSSLHLTWIEFFQFTSFTGTRLGVVLMTC
jgi:hypothetical protein